ncbi:MAG: ATP-binding cassette domain-containing protein [Oscillospiraceae bacterium]
MKIEMKGLTKEFTDNRVILDNVDFSDEIHTLAIIGPSGGGKSTLLRIVGGLLLPTAGEVWVDGEKLPKEERELQKYRRGLGFVFQQGGLFSHLSARENITLPLREVHGYGKEEAESRGEELLLRFGLAKDSHKKPAALSGGQQQRIAIARAIAARPKILLLDEPTSALDPEYTTEVLDLVGELKNEGLDFVIVTHEMGFARHACEKVAFLHGGKLLEYGNAQEVFSQPKTEALKAFLGKLLEWNV